MFLLSRDNCEYMLNCSVMSDSLDPMDCGPPGSSVFGIFQARILERVAVSSSRGRRKFNPGIEPESPALAGGFLTTEPSGKLIVLNRMY